MCVKNRSTKTDKKQPNQQWKNEYTELNSGLRLVSENVRAEGIGGRLKPGSGLVGDYKLYRGGPTIEKFEDYKSFRHRKRRWCKELSADGLTKKRLVDLDLRTLYSHSKRGRVAFKRRRVASGYAWVSASSKRQIHEREMAAAISGSSRSG